jgi:hypothetical protein
MKLFFTLSTRSTAFNARSSRALAMAIFATLAGAATIHNAAAADAAPAIKLSASPESVSSGESTTLTWSSTDADSCEASGKWSGSLATRGSKSTEKLSTDSTYTVTCKGDGGSASASLTVYMADQVPRVTFSAKPSTVEKGAYATLTWSATNSDTCHAYGPSWDSSEPTEGSSTTNGLTATTTFTLACFNANGAKNSAKATVMVTSSSTTTSAGQVQRPSYNTGNGFFVLNGKLYDANGNAFRPRGVDRAHYDSSSAAGIAKSGANTVRIFVGTNYGESVAGLVNIVQTQHIDLKEVPIPTSPSTTTGTATSCSTSTAVLDSVVANWVATASSWKPLDKYQIINIANEWGPSNSSAWATAYISAVKQMRAAGYLGTLLIDTGGCGQDELDLDTYATQVLAADPQHNLMFAYHVYGGTTTYQAPIAHASGEVITLDSDSATHPFAPTYNGSNNSYSGITQMVIKSPSGALTTIPVKQNVGGTRGAWTVIATAALPEIAAGSTVYDWGNYEMRIPRLAALASKGIAVAITEFGPGNNVGPSPTVVTPGEVISTAEASQIGWVAWAWDDNNLADCKSNNSWFSMTYNCGEYTQSSDLTTYGQEVVLNPTYGLAVLAKPASIFE